MPRSTGFEPVHGMLCFYRNSEINLMDREDKIVLPEVFLRWFEKDELT